MLSQSQTVLRKCADTKGQIFICILRIFFWSLLTRSKFLSYLHVTWRAPRAGEGLINVGFHIDKCVCKVLLIHGNIGGCVEENQLLCDSCVPVPSLECPYKIQL